MKTIHLIIILLSFIAISPAYSQVTPGSIDPASRAIYSWDKVSMTHTGSSGVTSRQWQLSTDGGSIWTNISGATSSTYNTGTLSNPSAVDIIQKYRVKVNGQNLYSGESVVTVIADITPGSISPSEQTINAGGSVTLTHIDSDGITWRQWQVSTNNGSTWTTISGATAATYNTGALANTETTSITHRYRLQLNSKSIYTAEAVITINGTGGGVTPGSISPATQTVASGGSASLTHSGSSGVTSRQWQQSTDSGSTWTDMPGATSSTYNTGALTNSGSSDITRRYRVKINGQTVYSSESVITVSGSGSSVTPGSISPATQTVASGGSVALTHSGSSGVTSRQWQQSTDNGTTWTDLSGATSSTYNTGALTNVGSSAITRRYRVKINGQTSYSSESVITVNGSASGVVPGSIDPAAEAIYSWDNVTMTHTGSSGVTSLQWQLSTDNGSTWSNISSATSASYNTGGLGNQGATDIIRKYRVKVNGQDLYSTESVVTVLASIIPGSISPSEQTVDAGSSVAMTHTGSEEINWRQWQQSTDNGSTWTNIGGANAATYNTGALVNAETASITRRYRIQINSQAIYSAESVITINGTGGGVTPGSISPSTQTVASGGSVALTHSGGTGITSRQWQQSTDNGTTWSDLSGATATTYNTGAITNTGSSDITRKYRVKINGQAVYSAESVITVSVVVTAGNITPATQTVASGGSVALTHSGGTGITTRQWEYTDNGTTWTAISGATAVTYNTGALTNTGTANITRRYRVKINGLAVYSTESVITVSVAVTSGSISPPTQTVASGGSVALAHSGGTGITTRQWEYTDNGSTWTAISGATAATYNTGALTNTGTANISRRYRLKINGQAVYSSESVITITVAVTSGSISPATQTVASGGSVALTHSGGTGITSRQWEYTDNGSTWTVISGATAATYNTGALTNTGTANITRRYRVKINGLAVYSAESVITITVAVTAGSISPATQTVASGGSVALTHSGGTGITSRQWEYTDNGSTWTTISGATAATYNTGALTNTGTANITRKYRVKINGLAVYSAESIITISAGMVPGSISPTTQSVASGNAATLTHTGSTGVTTRQWEYTDNGSTWTVIPGATAATYNTGVLTNTGSSNITRRYRVKINGQAIYSAESVVTITVVVIPGSISLANQTVDPGTSVTLTHSGYSGITSRQWEIADNGNSWTAIPGATAATYNTGALNNTGTSGSARLYRVKINGQDLSSSEAMILVRSSLTTGSISPATQTITSGNAVVLIHTVTSGTPSRLWQSSNDNGNTWTDTGVTGTTFNTGSLTNGGTIDITYRFRVKINGQDAYSSESVVTVSSPGVAVSPSTNRNYIHTIVPQEAVSSIPDAARNQSKFSETIEYFDGLGRPMQAVAVSASPDGKDIVTPVEYDAFGREATKYLPYEAATNNGSYKSEALGSAGTTGSQRNWYSTLHPGIPADTRPFSEIIFESSPLNRATDQYGPGEKWYAESPKKGAKTDYKANQANDVRLWTATELRVISGTPQPYYAAGTLYVTETTDEDRRVTTTCTDLQERMVSQRQTMDGTNQYAITDYVYNDFGQLAYVLPPAVPKTGDLTIDTVRTDPWFSKYVYAYLYDARGRVIKKHIPGAGWTHIVYNKLDQPILTQDPIQRAKSEWSYTKYDAHGRVVITGLYKPGSAIAYATLVQNVSAATQWENRGTASNGYTCTAFPTAADLSKCTILSVNYYDSYDFDYNGTDDHTYNGADKDSRVHGLPTGSKVRVVDTEEWLTTVMFYNNKGRMIYSIIDQPKVENAAVKDYITNTYDFTGRLLTSTRKQTKGGSDVFTLVTNNKYDHAGRLLTVMQEMDSGAGLTVADNTYNALGQLVKNKKYKNGGTVLEIIGYDYNIRGWLKEISSTYFSEKLHYHDVVGTLGNAQQWGGNISAMQWKAKKKDEYWHAYKYSYDKLSRLTKGDYSRSSGTSDANITYGTNPGLYNEDYTYDDNGMGNITALNRYHGDATAKADALTFTYTNTGNQVNTIVDAGTAFGFLNGTSTYQYDAAGRMKTDSRKGDVTYNHLNLPTLVKKGADELKYAYDAAGRKVKRQFKTEASRYYLDGVEYEGVNIKFIATPYGRIRKDGATWQYDYFLNDHLGNVRVVLTTDPNNLESSTSSSVSYVATMEEAKAEEEDQYFANIESTRADRPYNYPDKNPTNAKLAKIPGKSRGPSIMLKVMAGDTIQISAKAFYNMDKTLPGQGVDVAPILGSAIAAMTSAGTSQLGEAAQLAADLGAEASQSVALTQIPKKDDRNNAVQPKAGLNFVLYNDAFEIVQANTGVLLVEDKINTIQTLATDKMVMQEAGFLEVFVDNQAQTPVFFDNLMATQTVGPVMEVNAYYPYGMLIPNLGTIAGGDKHNAYKYNGKELQDMENFKTGWLDYGARMMEPGIGRWWCPDPRAEKYYSMSPYAYALNNPIRFIDPQGDTVRQSTKFQEDVQAMKSYNEWTSSKAGKRFLKDFGEGGKYENVSVVFDIADSDASGEAQMSAVNKDTGEEENLNPQRTIDKMKAEGIDVSGLRSRLKKDEYLRAKILVSGGVIDAQSVKQGGTFVHESQHVRMMHGDILKYGFIWYSGAEQHLFMKDVNKRWYKERLEYWQEKRPDYSIELINKIMNNFQYGRW